MAKNTPLPDKYVKALSLIKQGNLKYKDIAKTCKIPSEQLYDLIEGSAKRSPDIQEKFTKELEEINKLKDKKIRQLIKSCKERTFRLIDDYLVDQENAVIDEKLMSTLVSVANALSKSTPNVEIGSLTYQKGLSPEDIYAEFKRLNGLTSDRHTVPSLAAGGAGEVCVAPRARITVEEEPENPLLQGEPEA